MHEVSAPLEDATQRITERSPSPATGMQRTGGVGRDELDVDPPAGAEIEAGIALLAGRDHVEEHVVEPRVVEVEVDEAGASHLGPLDVRRRGGVQPFDELRGQLARHSPVALGRRHGHVGRPVAVLSPTGPLEVDRLGRLDARIGEGSAQDGGERVADHEGAFYRASSALTRSTRSSGSKGLVM